MTQYSSINVSISAGNSGSSLTITGPDILQTGSIYDITSSWATNVINSVNSISTSYAAVSNIANSANTLNRIPLLSISSSASIHSSTSDTADYALNAASSIYSLTASYIVPSLTTILSSSHASVSDVANSINFIPNTSISSLSSSFSTFAVLSNNSVSSSYSRVATTSNSSSWSPNQGATTLNTASVYFITSSWALASLSASYALNGGNGGSLLITGSLVPITASWATNAINAVTASAIPAFLPTNNAGMNIVGHINGNNTILQSNALVDATGNITASTFSGSGQFITGIISSSYSSVASTASYYNNTATTLNIGSTYQITSSQAISASWASQSLSSSYITPIQNYTTINTSSNNWVTLSFYTPNQQLNLDVSKIYNFTCSNVPLLGQVSDILLVISHSSAISSSLIFPSSWKNIGSAWPKSIPPNTVGVLWLRAIDSSKIIGSFNISGSNVTQNIVQNITGSVISSSYALTSSYALNGGSGLPSVSSSFSSTSLTSSYISQTNVQIFSGSLYLLDNTGLWWRVSLFNSGQGQATIQLNNP